MSNKNLHCDLNLEEETIPEVNFNELNNFIDCVDMLNAGKNSLSEDEKKDYRRCKYFDGYIEAMLALRKFLNAWRIR